MRKTLMLMLLAVAASPLAACKMPWQHDDKTPVATTTTGTTPTETTQADPATTEPVATAEAGKPLAPTSSPSPTPAVPATK